MTTCVRGAMASSDDCAEASAVRIASPARRNRANPATARELVACAAAGRDAGTAARPCQVFGGQPADEACCAVDDDVEFAIGCRGSRSHHSNLATRLRPVFVCDRLELSGTTRSSSAARRATADEVSPGRQGGGESLAGSVIAWHILPKSMRPTTAQPPGMPTAPAPCPWRPGGDREWRTTGLRQAPHVSQAPILAWPSRSRPPRSALRGSREPASQPAVGVPGGLLELQAAVVPVAGVSHSGYHRWICLRDRVPVDAALGAGGS